MNHHSHPHYTPHRQHMLWIVLCIILQFTVFSIILAQFSQFFFSFYWICVLVSILVSLYISTLDTRLAYKVAWVVPILLFPLIGGIMFIIAGGAKTSKHQNAKTDQVFRDQLPPTMTSLDLLPWGAEAMQQAWYLEHTALCPVYTQTKTQYFPTGEEFFPAFLDDLAQAEHYIFLEYFIIAEGSMWSEILDLLTQKAEAGVDVRIIYDGIGSAATLPDNYPTLLRDRGIQCHTFQPFRPVLNIRQNNRDHRKICVIDGEVGYVSGLNLADEYIGRLRRFGYWKDNALRLDGDAVWSLTIFFLTMWDEHNTHTDYTQFRPRRACPVWNGGGLVAPYIDTPLPEDTVCADLFLQMITKAKRYLYITTPYLIIDESIASALTIAARSGVDVRIMTPHIPDKKMVFAVTRSNYPELLRAGVRIYEYLPGFIHSKTLVADDLYATVGSCNLDYRSFYLQFENGVWLYSDPAVLSVRDDFLQSAEVCQEVNLDDFRDLSLFRRLLWSIFRLFSPLF